MTPTIIDADTGRTLWLSDDCVTHCGISAATWRSYVRKDMPPKPVATLGLRDLWDADEIRTWNANRPSRS